VQQAERRAKARQRALSDRYATVTGGAPVAKAPVARPDAEDDAPTGPSRPAAAGRGRVAPTPRSQVARSNAAGRNQPSRKPKSKRRPR
jgi:preprotein translocase subunit SecF